MTPRYQYIFNPALIFLFLVAFSAARASGFCPPDSTQRFPSDSTEQFTGKFIKNIELSFDYGKLLTMPFDFENKTLLGAGIYFRNNFGLNVEAGYGKLMPETAYKNADYRITGIYGTAGFDYLYEYNPGTRLYLGAKYARCRFSDQGTFTILDPLWADYTGSFERKGLSAEWAELAGGSESSWKGNLFLGFIVRFRILIKYPQFDDINVYAIPGYGRTDFNTVPAVSLYIKYLFLHKMPDGN